MYVVLVIVIILLCLGLGLVLSSRGGRLLNFVVQHHTIFEYIDWHAYGFYHPRRTRRSHAVFDQMHGLFRQIIIHKNNTSFGAVYHTPLRQ